jgi:hypothetical protein
VVFVLGVFGVCCVLVLCFRFVGCGFFGSGDLF